MTTVLSPAPMILRFKAQDVSPLDPLTFEISLVNIESQNYTQSFDSNGGSIVLQYDGLNVKIGDWITNDVASQTYQITDIRNPTPGRLECTVTDRGGLYSSTTYSGSPAPTSNAYGYIFRVNEDNVPILAPALGAASDLGPTWQGDLISLFAARNSKTQYVSINQVNTFTVGESIYIDSSGVFQKSAGSLKISDTVGIVTSKGIPSDNWFSFRPSGKYFDTSLVPHDFVPTPQRIEQVSGSNVTLIGGMKLYINSISGGRQYTTVKRGSNAFATWILIDANRAIYIAGSGGGGGGGSTAVQVFDGGDPYWESAPPTTIYPVLDCGGI